MSVSAYSGCGGINNSFTPVMEYSSAYPLPWDYMEVATTDGTNPLIVNYYLGGSGGTLQFVHTWTYDDDGVVESLTIS